jgi:hypothetical protein
VTWLVWMAVVCSLLAAAGVVGGAILDCLTPQVDVHDWRKASDDTPLDT